MHDPPPVPADQEGPSWSRVDDKLAQIERVREAVSRRVRAGASQAAPSIIAGRADARATRIALFIKGAESSWDDLSMDGLVGIFPSTVASLYFNYNGPEGDPYTPADIRPGTVKTFADLLGAYFDHYGAARFTLVCHSLGGLVAAQYLSEQGPEMRTRVERVFLLASPVLMDGGAAFAEAESRHLSQPVWRVVGDYEVMLVSIPVLDRFTALHCQLQKDIVAPYQYTCLSEFEAASYRVVDEEVEGATHFNIPTRAVERLRAELLR